MFAEGADGAGDALAGGGFGDLQGGGDLVEGEVLVEAEEDGGAVGVGEGGDGGVELVVEVGGGFGGGGGGGALGGDFAFARGAAALFAAEVFDGERQGVEEPAGEFQFRCRLHALRPLVEEDEDGLRGVFGEVRVTELAIGGGEDPASVLGDEGAEGIGARGSGGELGVIDVLGVVDMGPRLQVPCPRGKGVGREGG